MTTIVIMPGGFHPFHAGHYALYQSAQRTFPDAEVYVAATNDTSSRPFPFPVKEKLAKLAGVEAGHFVQVKSPFRAEEITAKFDPARDTLIFVRSEKDSTKPPQPGGIKKDGSPSYLQPLLGAKKLEPFARHAYMAYLPTVEFGPGMTSATEIRSAWPQLNEKRKTALVMSLYPRTQGNAKLAATVVGLLDAAIGTELNEFAPGSGGGESGRWYTDDQMTDIVGDGWWNDLDVSGNISKQQMIQEAQAWLDDQGYNVQVLNCRLNDDDMDWYIEGNFHNPGFAKKGVAEGTEQDAKFTPRPEIRSRIETQLDQYLDPEKVAGAYTDVQYYKHDSRVYVEVLFHYTDGQKIGPKQRKRFLVNKDFTLTPIKGQSVTEGSESSIQKKIQAKQDSLSLAREQRRARGQRQQGPREIKLQAEIDKLNTELTQLKGQGVAEGGNPVDHEWYRKQQERKAKAAKRQDQQQRQMGVAEGAPIVVAQAPIDVRNPKKAPQPYRNQGDIVPDTKPPSTEKRGVKGRPGQRPMPKYDENNDYLDE
jgi:hypothetical protein